MRTYVKTTHRWIFQKLTGLLIHTHETTQQRAGSAVNMAHTIRNWLFGHYIVEYEQNGEDYAAYRSRLLYRISDTLKKGGVKGMSYTNLTLFRKFYLLYPHFGGMVADFIGLDSGEKIVIRNLQTASEDFEHLKIEPAYLLQRLSFSHFVELLKVEKPIQRRFYEIECMQGNWTRIQLQRQIGSLLYERTGLSTNKQALLGNLPKGKNDLKIEDIIRDPYVFEFAGLQPLEVFQEKELEKALLDHLQQFLLELGTGFCFEARQKSFLIDNRRFKVDLLFYHRVLKCHVMIDLKTDEFKHEDAGQMNFYLNYHKDNEMTEGDNPPVGIVLCTGKNETVVKYATGSLESQILVSKYMLQLPDEKLLLQFIENKKRTLGF